MISAVELNGFFILLERFIKNKSRENIEGKSSLFNTVVLKIYTLLVINFSWVLFRAPHTKDAIQFIGIMLGILTPENAGFTVFWYLDKWTVTIMLLAIFFASSWPMRLGETIQRHVSEKMVATCKYAALLMTLYFSMLRIVAGTYNPFIYFQF